MAGGTRPKQVVTVDEGAAIVVGGVSVQPSVRMPLLDAVGHVLASSIVAAIDLPPWTNASMDGFAVHGADLAEATPETPATFRVIAATAAGAPASRAIARGEATRIFTGAPLPEGADSVVRQEDSSLTGDQVTVGTARDAFANVRKGGGDVARGVQVFAAGTPLGPRQLALLAALGEAAPMVHRKPRIGIISTGDEIVSLDRQDEIANQSRLADVNGIALSALVHDAGGVAVPLGIARDTVDAVREIVDAAVDVDMILSAGGASVGDHDHVGAAMFACGVLVGFDRVRVRPGGPTMFGSLPDGRTWLALPGNPVSAMVTFELFGRPAIRRMMGHRDVFAPKRIAELGSDVRQELTLDQYLRVTINEPPGADLAIASLTGPQGSGILTSMAAADGLAIIPSGNAVIRAGTAIQVIRFS